MRNLLGTHMGHSGIYTMVSLLQSPQYYGDAQLLRGAVFHITMALWGTKRVDKLKCTHTSILPAFLFVRMRQWCRSRLDNHSFVRVYR